MPCTRSTACKVLQMEGRLSVPGDGYRYPRPSVSVSHPRQRSLLTSNCFAVANIGERSLRPTVRPPRRFVSVERTVDDGMLGRSGRSFAMQAVLVCVGSSAGFVRGGFL
jgi:hypothetical protein